MAEDDKTRHRADAEPHFEDDDILSSSPLLNFQQISSAEDRDEAADIVVSAGLPADRVTFSNLSALVPTRDVPPPPQKSVQKVVERVDSISVVAPPSFGRFALWSVAVLVLLAMAWIGSRSSWNFSRLAADPIGAIQAAIHANPPAVVAQKSKIPATEIDLLEGRLKVEPVSVELVDTKKKSRFAKITGRVVNESNRIQHSITLRITMTDQNGLALASQKINCCRDFTQTNSPEVTRLSPGDAGAYSLKMELPRTSGSTLKARVELLFSEMESPR